MNGHDVQSVVEAIDRLADAMKGRRPQGETPLEERAVVALESIADELRQLNHERAPLFRIAAALERRHRPEYVWFGHDLAPGPDYMSHGEPIVGPKPETCAAAGCKAPQEQLRFTKGPEGAYGWFCPGCEGMPF